MMGDINQISPTIPRDSKEFLIAWGFKMFSPLNRKMGSRKVSRKRRKTKDIFSPWIMVCEAWSFSWHREVEECTSWHIIMHPSRCACGKSELELFSILPTQTAIESSQWVEYRPVTTLSDYSHIEFVITGSGEEYLDLSKTYLQNSQTRWTWVEPDQSYWWNCVRGWCRCGPCQLVAPFFLQPSGCESNWMLSHPSMNTYPYQVYLETLLSYGPAVKISYLTAALWYKDTANHMDDHQLNKAFKGRQVWTMGCRQVVMIGRLPTSICVFRIEWCWME